ncbi:hypothetical protein X777_05716 [Ooceraea biroi]|uniref:Uncharacterized protein n=1 Tax=Ooceraea biroi TaxID=2015173 RepID=A0A026WEC1_OOCBI|nr:hypothetical protein X777_05716 [Ooceraea biroi]
MRRRNERKTQRKKKEGEREQRRVSERSWENYARQVRSKHIRNEAGEEATRTESRQAGKK